MSSVERPIRRLHLELRGDLSAVAAQVERVEAFLGRAGCNAASIHQMAVVAEEILTNVIRHAWGGRETGLCSVDVEAIPKDGAIQVTLRTEDEGIAFNPLESDPPDLDAPLEERSIGGLGVHLVRTMTDTQAYRRVGGRNIFEVSKTCPLTDQPSART